MSSNGVILQDYVPNAINNITEQIWVAGGVIPRGKRVVIGKNRDGWQEVTFTMGPNQDIIGMAMVPPSILAVETHLPRGFGFMPGNVAATRARARRGGAIDQNAPLPSPVPDFSPQGGQFTVAEAARRARMEQALPADQPRSPAYRPPPYQPSKMSVSPGTGGPVWPVGMPAVVARSRIARPGFGAAGASEFTMKAAEELDEHLTTNGCAGCDDYKSTLRQLAFKFKAACMTDPGIQNQVSFNISTPLAMTAYGSGTDKALTLVLGQKRTYDGGPCTDDNGACLGNLPQIAQVTPVALGPLITQIVNQVSDQIQQHQAQPMATQLGRQEPLVNGLVAATTGLFTAISAALSKVTPIVVTQPAPKPEEKKPEEKKTPWGTILLGGLIGSAVLGTGVLVYTHARRG